MNFEWHLFRLIYPLILAALLLGSMSSSVFATTEKSISFNDDVRPIFVKHCLACHGGVKQAAGLSLVYEDQVVGDDSWIIEKGLPDESAIIERVTSNDPEFVMPPPEHGEALTKEEIGSLRQWIKEGARWEKHWAFELPQVTPLPLSNSSQWPINGIDNYVLRKLEDRGIVPAPDARPERWLRRVTLDLTGLPPTVDERNQFLQELSQVQQADQVERVYQAVVEGLLDSTAYGERWASVWLDQMRYADSKGLGSDGRRNIWKYRDWVIDALNRDLPFDEFTIKQIAGDLKDNPEIDDILATAAHRLTQTNEEGGTDDEEFRIAAVLDRANTTWQAWQGITFGCVQCHSHPYEPIRHDEYYKFAAFFNNTADCDLSQEWPTARIPLDTQNYGEAGKLDREIKSLNQEVWQREYSIVRRPDIWQPVVGLDVSSNKPTKVVVQSNDDYDEFRTVDTVSQNTDFTLAAPIPMQMDSLSAVRLTALPLNVVQAESDSEWGFSLSHIEMHLVSADGESKNLKIDRVFSDEPEPFFDPQQSLNPKSPQGFAAYTRIYKPRTAVFVLEQPIAVSKSDRLKMVLKHRIFMLSAFPLVIRRGHVAVSDSDAFHVLQANSDYVEQQTRLAELKRRRKLIPSTSVPVLQERTTHLARKQHVFVRGLFLTKDKQVSPNTPQSFAGLEKQPRAFNRMDMANWLVSANNPLTARVAVNRIWARLFGIGLVATEEDFGSSGDRPSHPDLLDYLAIKFQGDFGWSQKKLLKQLVLSRTYRQDSSIREDLQQRDPQNRLLARGPRHRLPAEVVRDQGLAISGLLSRKMFGPPVHPPLPKDVWKPFAGGDQWKTPDTNSKDRYRRSVYTYTKRSIPFPMFAAFDSPSREFCQPRRLRSNTPIQALMMLNDQTAVECAAAFANRMQEFAETVEAQLKFGFIAATCREPTEPELAELKKLLELYPGSRDDGFTAVAAVLLNLDEVLIK